MNLKYFAIGVWRKLAPSHFFGADHSPIRCGQCGGGSFVQINTALLDTYGPVTEAYQSCLKCDACVQEWAYGAYNPANTEPEPWPIVFRRLLSKHQFTEVTRHD